jgi:hypothetical protein
MQTYKSRKALRQKMMEIRSRVPQPPRKRAKFVITTKPVEEKISFCGGKSKRPITMPKMPWDQ